MPDLGKYATEILSAYGISILILGVLVWASIARARRSKARLEEVERKHG